MAAAADKTDAKADPKIPAPKRSAPTKTHRKSVRSRSATSASELSQTDYDTCKELEEVEIRRRNGGATRKPRKGHRKSGSESEGARGPMAEEAIAAVVQKCLKEALPTIQEHVGTKADTATEYSRPEVQAPTPAASGDASMPSLMGSFNPHMMPLMKFKGEDWEDFIEHFESFADACRMTEAYRLQYLLMSLEGKPRAYAKKEEGEPYTYASVRRRLQHRYGKRESAFEVRHQLRSVTRKPGESLEEFSDRLQEIAQQGNLDDKDRDELFYFAFLNAVGDIPKMQYYIEQAHSKNRNLKISDLLALAREYLERSPTARRRSVAVNVCKPIGQRKGRLQHCDEEVANDVEVEVNKIDHERREKKEASVATMRKDLGFLLREYEFQNKCIKYNGLHKNLREKAKTFKGTLLPRDMPSRELYPGFAEPWRDRTNPQERRFERPKADEKKRTENPNGSAVEADGKE